MSKTIVMDTREQKGKHDHVTKRFEELGYKIVRSKLLCGDYTYLQNMSICVDTKKDIQEICGNVCQQHHRFIREIQRSMENEIKLVFLINNEDGVEKLEDLINWENPRLKISSKAITGEKLYKSLATIENRYNTKFYFTTNEKCADTIIKILDGGMDD